MTLTETVPVKEMEKNRRVIDVVEQQLREDRNNAYTIAGLMITCYKVKESEINKPFMEWEKGLPNLYTQIRVSLEKLTNAGKLKKAKKGRAILYWYIWEDQ